MSGSEAPPPYEEKSAPSGCSAPEGPPRQFDVHSQVAFGVCPRPPMGNMEPAQGPPPPPPQDPPKGPPPDVAAAQNAPVVTQPVNNVVANTVVVQQPVATSEAMRDWNTPLCGCSEDATICVVGWFCQFCLLMKTSKDMDETCWLPCCVPMVLVPLRTKWRLQHNIEGSIINDCCLSTFCGPCATCQLAREIKLEQKMTQPLNN